MVMNGAKSTAMINGRVRRVGDVLDNVMLVTIGPDYAAVALGAHTNVLTLRK